MPGNAAAAAIDVDGFATIYLNDVGICEEVTLQTRNASNGLCPTDGRGDNTGLFAAAVLMVVAGGRGVSGSLRHLIVDLSLF